MLPVKFEGMLPAELSPTIVLGNELGPRFTRVPSMTATPELCPGRPKTTPRSRRPSDRTMPAVGEHCGFGRQKPASRSSKLIVTAPALQGEKAKTAKASRWSEVAPAGQRPAAIQPAAGNPDKDLDQGIRSAAAMSGDWGPLSPQEMYHALLFNSHKVKPWEGRT
jgi:hypothetical protein